VLLSLGLQGVVLELSKVLAGQSFSFGTLNEERLEWSSPPLSCQVSTPFLLSVLNDGIEIHDLKTLTVLQKILVPSPSPHVISLYSDFLPSLNTPSTTTTTTTNNSSNNNSNSNSYSPPFQVNFVCNGEQAFILKLIPLTTQVFLFFY
jgi:hypothetical protein